jgi:aspartyl-tRNA(Asn)/glutamyl-tRNA(Gln) amidotransferase subunit C
MSINKKLIHELGAMSKIDITPKEEQAFVNDISNLLAWIEKLNEVDTQNIEPLYSTSTEINVLRNDEPINYEFDCEDLLKLGPDSNSAYFKVPNI